MEALLISLLPSLISLVPQVITAWESNTTNSLAAVAKVVAASPAAATLAAAGASEFPLLTPALQAAAAALAAMHTDNTTFIQNAINDLVKAGTMKLSGLLAADGSYGPITKAAVTAFQALEGLPQTGAVDDTTYNSLYALIAKM